MKDGYKKALKLHEREKTKKQREESEICFKEYVEMEEETLHKVFKGN